MIVAIPALLKKEAVFLITFMLSYIKEHAGHVHMDEYHPLGWPPAMTKEWATWEK